MYERQKTATAQQIGLAILAYEEALLKAHEAFEALCSYGYSQPWINYYNKDGKWTGNKIRLEVR